MWLAKANQSALFHHSIIKLGMLKFVYDIDSNRILNQLKLFQKLNICLSRRLLFYFFKWKQNQIICSL